ncbi:hypothetical protein AGDE_17128 [Angomonas deanei]|nr:hypothetical protein AGDE_17128 [Angomonas deanei]|eukprot:EPY15421.1 hypothetical protein AGDE_17128 [Angomonas deanei]
MNNLLQRENETETRMKRMEDAIAALTASRQEPPPAPTPAAAPPQVYRPEPQATSYPDPFAAAMTDYYSPEDHVNPNQDEPISVASDPASWLPLFKQFNERADCVLSYLLETMDAHPARHRTGYELLVYRSFIAYFNLATRFITPFSEILHPSNRVERDWLIGSFTALYNAEQRAVNQLEPTSHIGLSGLLNPAAARLRANMSTDLKTRYVSIRQGNGRGGGAGGGAAPARHIATQHKHPHGNVGGAKPKETAK